LYCNLVKYYKQIVYVFSVLLSTYDFKYTTNLIDNNNIEIEVKENNLFISYGYLNKRNHLKQIHIYASDFFGENYLKSSSLPQIQLDKYKDVPVLYSSNDCIDDYVKKSANIIETNIDLIASSFFMLTRYEEMVNTTVDRYERFPALESFAFKNDFLGRPIVNDYIELLWEWIHELCPDTERKLPWKHKDFAVCLSHDIDNVRRYKKNPPLGAIRRSLKNGDLNTAVTRLKDYTTTKLMLKNDPYIDATHEMINMEKSYNFNSSFYFMSDNQRYSLKEKAVQVLIKNLQSNDFEIGAHPSISASLDEIVMVNEKAKLEGATGISIIGGRQHYLRFKIPFYWRILEVAKLEYDNSLTFADYEGFRCGICFPYKPFDLLDNREIDLWIIPLTIMDVTLESYRKLSAQKALDVMISLSKIVKKYGGILSLLWHNSHYCSLYFPGWEVVYSEFCKYLSNQNTIVGSCSSILELWVNNIDCSDRG
jgi:hypothetical protein